MPNQYSFTREQIRKWARQGLLTPERIARIEEAARKGNVTREDSAPTVDQQPKPPPAIGGTEITAQKITPSLPWWW